MSYCQSVSNCIPVDDSISHFSSSIFTSPRYLSRQIPCSFNFCQCFNTSALTIASFKVFATQMKTFDKYEINCSASTLSVRSVDIAPDNLYLTWKNCIPNYCPAFCNTSLNINIKSASDFCLLNFLGENNIFFFVSHWLRSILPVVMNLVLDYCNLFESRYDQGL